MTVCVNIERRGSAVLNFKRGTNHRNALVLLSLMILVMIGFSASGAIFHAGSTTYNLTFSLNGSSERNSSIGLAVTYLFNLTNNDPVPRYYNLSVSFKPVPSGFNSTLIPKNVSIQNGSSVTVYLIANASDAGTYHFNLTATKSDNASVKMNSSADLLQEMVLNIADMTVPVVSDIHNTTTNETADITFTTDDSANSTIEYGTTLSMAETPLTNISFIQNHVFNLTGLINDTPYYFNITSCNSDGYCAEYGPYTFMTEQTIDMTAPVVSNLHNTTTNETADITFTTDDSANSTIEYGTTLSMAETPLTNISFIQNHVFNLTGLINDTPYYFNITSCNSDGYCAEYGPYTFMTEQTIDMTAPVVSNLHNTTTNETADITFTTDDSANSTIEYGTTLSMAETPLTNISFIQNHVFNLTGLINDTPYYFNITSCNSDGYCAEYGPYTFMTEQTIDMTAPVVSNLHNTTTNETADITFTTDDSANSTIEYGTTLSMAETPLTNISFIQNHVFNLTGLINDTPYYFNITSCNSDGYCAEYGPYTFMTEQTIDMTAPVVSNLHNTTTNETADITFTTDDSANPSINYGTTSSLGSIMNNLGFATSHTFNLSNLVPNTTYYFNLTVCNSGSYCNEIGAYNFITNATPIVITPSGGNASTDNASVQAQKNKLNYKFILRTENDAEATSLKSNIIANLYLPTQMSDVNLTWNSANPAVVDSTGKVTRPVADTSVTLTANLSKNSQSVTKPFTFTVKAKVTASVPVSGKVTSSGTEMYVNSSGFHDLTEAVSTADEYTAVSLNLGDSADQVTGKLALENALTLTRQTSAGTYSVSLPLGTLIYGGPGWNGVFKLPTRKNGYTVSGGTVYRVIDIGSGAGLNFSKPVKITFKGMSAYKAGWAMKGNSALTKISTPCDSATNPTNINNVTDPKLCYTISSGDLIIWTYHFTEFGTYTPDSGGGGGGGGSHSSGSSSTAVCTPSWSCTPWTECKAWGVRDRECTDANSCTVSDQAKPVTVQDCLYDPGIAEDEGSGSGSGTHTVSSDSTTESTGENNESIVQANGNVSGFASQTGQGSRNYALWIISFAALIVIVSAVLLTIFIKNRGLPWWVYLWQKRIERKFFKKDREI